MIVLLSLGKQMDQTYQQMSIEFVYALRSVKIARIIKVIFVFFTKYWTAGYSFVFFYFSLINPFYWLEGKR